MENPGSHWKVVPDFFFYKEIVIFCEGQDAVIGSKMSWVCKCEGG